MVNWQLSKQGICWPLSHDGTAGSDGNSSRSRVFLEVFRWPVVSFKLIPDSRLCFHSCGYGFVDFFAMVWNPLSEVNLKCINGNFVLSSGLSGRLLLYRTRNQKAKCIPCRGCALKAENNKYTVPDTEAVESIFVAFLKHLQTYFHGFSCHLKNSEF